MPTNHHVLLIEDDASLASWIADYLNANQLQVSVANQGDLGLELIESDDPDLVILDLNLPVLDGLAVCRQAREFYTKPILMLTARDQEDDEILGLDSGANDYLIKPVRPKILLARVQSLIRHGIEDPQATVIRIGSLSLDYRSRIALVSDTKLELSSHEFDLLWVLAENVGNPVHRDQLTLDMRGIEYDGFDRSIDICISRLRKKFSSVDRSPDQIVTVRGKGYLLAPDGW